MRNVGQGYSKTGSYCEYLSPRRLQNEEIHILYRSPNIVKLIKSRRLRWVSDVVRMEEDRRAFKTFKGKPTGKRTLGMPRRGRVYNIRTDLK